MGKLNGGTDANYFEMLADFYDKVSMPILAKKYGVSRRTLERHRKKMQAEIDAITPEFYDACLRRSVEIFNFVTLPHSDGFKLRYRTQKNFVSVSVSRLMTLFRRLKGFGKPVIRYQDLPDYFEVVDYDNAFGTVPEGVWYVAVYKDKMPPEMYSYDPVTCEIELHLKFEIPRSDLTGSESVLLNLLTRYLKVVTENMDIKGSMTFGMTEVTDKQLIIDSETREKLIGQSVSDTLLLIKELEATRESDVEVVSYRQRISEGLRSESETQRLLELESLLEVFEQEKPKPGMPRDVSDMLAFVMITDFQTWWYDEFTSDVSKRKALENIKEKQLAIKEKCRQKGAPM